MNDPRDQEIARLREENEQLRALLADARDQLTGRDGAWPARYGLTASEQGSLDNLMKRDVATYDALALGCVGTDPDAYGSNRRSIHVLMSRIRNKMPIHIRSIPDVGSSLSRETKTFLRRVQEGDGD